MATQPNEKPSSPHVVIQRAETGKAYLFSFVQEESDEDARPPQCWVPKSCVVQKRVNDAGETVVTIHDWLLRKNGIIS